MNFSQLFIAKKLGHPGFFLASGNKFLLEFCSSSRNLAGAERVRKESRTDTGKGGESSSRPTDPKGGDTEKRVVGDGPKRGESRPTDKRVRDGTGQGGGFGEALK